MFLTRKVATNCFKYSRNLRSLTKASGFAKADSGIAKTDSGVAKADSSEKMINKIAIPAAVVAILVLLQLQQTNDDEISGAKTKADQLPGHIKENKGILERLIYSIA